MKTAKLIKENLPKFIGIAHLYELSPSCQGSRYVIASTTYVSFSGYETYLFPSDKEGNVTEWGELEGSTKGNVPHEKIFSSIGYTVVQND